ncbi:rhombosortase [Vibrio stylophorae]|uniref:rhombosortase n=1 Tax=Vibrio stylophorae TaxID=659351 RepID=UPI001F00C8AE|nr:rhombosortase [Vibrio stylophorae]
MTLYLQLIAITLICLLCQWPALLPQIEWQQQAIHDGQYWRLVTGNFGHTNWAHLTMNLAALWLLTGIYGRYLHHWRLSVLLLLLSFALGLWMLDSQITRYLGLSGVLHGMASYGAVQDCATPKMRWQGWGMLAAISLKMIAEQCYNFDWGSAALIGAHILTIAHLRGALLGLGFGLVALAYQHYRNINAKTEAKRD